MEHQDGKDQAGTPRPRRTLTVARETLRALGTAALRQAAGGTQYTTDCPYSAGGTCTYDTDCSATECSYGCDTQGCSETGCTFCCPTYTC